MHHSSLPEKDIDADAPVVLVHVIVPSYSELFPPTFQTPVYTIEGSRSSSVVVYSTTVPAADALAVSVLWDRPGTDIDEDLERPLAPGAVEPPAVTTVAGDVVAGTDVAAGAAEVAGAAFDVVDVADCPGLGAAGGVAAAV